MPIETPAGHKPEAPLGQLLRDLVRDVRELLRGEIDLAKAEVRESLARLSRALVLVALGTGLALAAALTLLFTLNRGLTALYVLGMEPATAVWLAPLTLTVVFASAAALILRKGAAVLQATQVLPRETGRSLRESKEWLKTRLS
jgi:uncharacterized membrane protein YqjE